MASTTLPDLLDEVRDLTIDDDEALDALRLLLKLRGVVDHLAATTVGVVDRLGLAKARAQKLPELLISLGCSPGVATRWIRISKALPVLPTLAAHCADGAVSGEHADAIVKGINHIAARAPNPVTEEARFDQVTDLLGQCFSGAKPSEIEDRARILGNQVAGAQGGLPAGEDRSINTVDLVVTSDGRMTGRINVDGVVGAKIIAGVEGGSAPRPEPDGTPDARSAARRRADALEAVFDTAARGGEVASAPLTQLLVTVPADTPDVAKLEYIGPISRSMLDQISCDCTVTTIIVDGEQVPLDMGREKRLFPAHLRKALYQRDGGCIKCGAPAGRTHCHHIAHWVPDGETCLDNGCLLCPACHADIHHGGWDVVMGMDRHPWLIPPATVDKHRKPLPAYNRRTMRLDTVAA